MARAARYWMKTTGAEADKEMLCLRTVLNMRLPGGDTQTFVPLPRPETCVVAVAVVPIGRCESQFGFLSRRDWVLVTTSPYRITLP